VSFGCVSEGFKLLKSCRFSVAGILVFSSSRSREDPRERDELFMLKEISFYANARPRSRTRSFGGSSLRERGPGIANAKAYEPGQGVLYLRERDHLDANAKARGVTSPRTRRSVGPNSSRM